MSTQQQTPALEIKIDGIGLSQYPEKIVAVGMSPLDAAHVGAWAKATEIGGIRLATDWFYCQSKLELIIVVNPVSDGVPVFDVVASIVRGVIDGDLERCSH